MRWFLFLVALAISSYAQSQQTVQHKQPAQWSFTENREIDSKQYHQTTKSDEVASPPVATFSNTEPQSGKTATSQTGKDENYERSLAEYTRELAIFTEVLALATVLLVVVSIWQGRQLKRSVDLAREEFITSHRPRIIVRRASHIGVDGQDAVQYIIANTGDTVATIVEISTKLWRELGGDKGDPEWKRYRTIQDYNPSVAVSIRINSGEHITEVACKHGQIFSQFDFPGGGLDEPEPKPDPTTGKDLLFLGYVVYTDGVGRWRTTAFCRRYVKLTKRFVPIKDKDYEYQD